MPTSERVVTRVLSDSSGNGTITVRYLFGPDGAPLANIERLVFENPAFYLTDRQNSVLQIVDGGGQTLKRVRYSGLEVRPGDRVINPAWVLMDRLELGGQMYDHFTGLSMLSGSWFHPKLGRNLTEGGRGIGLNPYPVAENNAPNEVKPEPVTDVDAERRADRLAWQKYRMGWAHDILDGFVEPIHMADDVMRTYGFAVELAWAEARRGKGADIGLPNYRSKLAQGWIDAEINGYKGQAAGSSGAYWADAGEKMGEGLLMPWKPLSDGVQKWRKGEDDGQEFFNAVGGTLWFFLPGPKGAGAGGRTAGAPAAVATSTSRLAQAAKAVGRGTANVALTLGLPVGTRTLLSGAGWGIGRGLNWRRPGWEGAYSDWAHGRHNANTWGGTAAIKLGEWLRWKVCFTAEMPMRSPLGWVRADAVVVGMELWSQDEFDPDGPVVAKVVEEVFKREGLVTHLRLPNGVTIRSTDAVLTSFTATCERHGIDPWVYLADVLTRLPSRPADRVAELLPDTWAQAQRRSS